MRFVSLLFLFITLLQAEGPKVIDLSRLRFRYFVPQSVIDSINYEDISEIDSKWTHVSEQRFPWHKVQFVDGWYNSGINAGIFIGFQAPLHKLMDDEYITNWMVSLQESGGDEIIYKGETRIFSQLQWRVYEIQSAIGDGLFVTGGSIPTVMFLAITQLEPPPSSHIHPLIVVYGGAPEESRTQLFSTLTKFLKTVSIGKVARETKTVALGTMENPDTVSKPDSEVKVSYIKVEEHRTAGVGYTRYPSGFQGVSFKFLKGIKTELSIGGLVDGKGKDDYEYHLDACFEPFELKIKSPVYIGIVFGGRYYRDRTRVYNLSIPIKAYLKVGGIAAIVPMFGISYTYNEKLRRHTMAGGWGLQIIF